MHFLRLSVALAALAALVRSQDDPSLLRRVPDAWTNVVHIRDVLPAVERVLQSPALEDAWKDAAEGLAVIEPGLRGVAPRFLLGPLALLKAQVPTEVVFAAPAGTLDDFGALYQAVVTAFLGWMVVEQGQIEDPALYDYRTTAVESLVTMGAPLAYFAVRARSERVAETWFDAVADDLAAFGERAGYDTAGAIDPDEDDGGGLIYLIVSDEIQGRIEVGRFLESGRAGGSDVWERMAELGLLPADHAATARLREHAASLTMEFRVARRGDVVELQLGDVDVARAGGVRASEPTPLMSSTWEMVGMVDRADQVLETLYSLDDASIEFLEDRMPGAFDQLLDQATAAVEQGASGRMSLEIGESSLEVVTWEPFDPEFDWTPPTARATGITAFVPGPKTWVTATGYLTLDEWLFSDYDAVAWGLDDVAAETWDRDLEELSDLADTWSGVMISDLSDLYDFLSGGDSAVFEDGTVFVLDVADDGPPAWAVVGLPYSRDDAVQFVAEAARLLLDGLEIDAEAVTSTVALTGGPDALVLALPGAPVDSEALDNARFAPHAVVSDDALILSTSAALTRELLAARARGGAREIDPELVTDQRLTGAGCAAILEALGRHLPDGGLELRQARALLDGMAALARLVGEVTVTERIDGDGLSTQVRVGLRD